MQLATFRKRHPVPLTELLVSPLIFREGLPFLLGAPPVRPALLRDLAHAMGHSDAAFRTALSRLRSSGLVEQQLDETGEPYYRRGELSRSLQATVASQLVRPDGFTLVIFAFATENARERHLVREALRLHGFQRLAQNTYIGGAIDMHGLEAAFERDGLTDNVFVFRTREDLPDNVRTRLASLFDLPRRATTLRALHRDLLAFLDDPSLDGAARTRRLLYAGPVHYRVTFVEEPQLPRSAHPPDYPLTDVVTLLQTIAEQSVTPCVRYFGSFERASRGRGGSRQGTKS